MDITVIFEKDSQDKGLHCGWGIAYLIGDEVLFDAGEKYEYLADNFKKLGVSTDAIRHIVISHNHWDHRQGIWPLLKEHGGMDLWVCEDFAGEFKSELQGHTVHIVEGVQPVIPGVFTSGCVPVQYKNKKICEQALVIKGKEGLCVVCGCAHPGLIDIVREVTEYFEVPVYALLGGFHLMDKDARFVRYLSGELRAMGVKKIFPGHCTGYDAIKILEEEYREDCMTLKTGMKIAVS
ncbi:MAG: MBL fold metallo-hydrolase [Candidatus Omnitrophica bacterium]|nr:MBL fold metallo-hydrolase [Candidatus Omnitrophota bacterium]